MTDKKTWCEHIEALLFSAVKPLSIDIIGEVLSLSSEEVEEILSYMEDVYYLDRGIHMKRTSLGIELVAKETSFPYIKQIRQKEEKLSTAALETLAVVVFKQPVTKAEIEEIRGVNCEKVLKSLQDKGLIEERGRKDTIGRPLLYGTTNLFLHSVGAESLEGLQKDLHIYE